MESNEKRGFTNVFRSLLTELRDLFDLHFDTDAQGTVESIKKSIDFKGGNLWALIFAAFIASIGLNVDSGAVVIGAMLISPLMGPIVGAGYSIATNEFDTLKNSIRNLLIFVIGSIFASSIYFLVTPLKGLTAQLEARTYPTFYDVLIAICGGAIGIVASSRSDRGNAIPGVAIATALMPPLCTVGYGLATAHWTYAAGAFYLFFINSVFIALTAFLFVRALNFPKKEFLDPIREKRHKSIMFFIVVATIIPSFWTAYNVVQKELFDSKVVAFQKKVKVFKLDQGLIVGELEANYYGDTSIIVMTVMGAVTDRDKELLQGEMIESGLAKAHLSYRESSGFDNDLLLKELDDMRSKFAHMSDEYTGIIEDLYSNNRELLEDKNKRIDLLESELKKYSLQQKYAEKPIDKAAIEISALFPQIKEISYSEQISVQVENNRLDTIPTVILDWHGRRAGSTTKSRIESFFIARFDVDTIQIIYN